MHVRVDRVGADRGRDGSPSASPRASWPVPRRHHTDYQRDSGPTRGLRNTRPRRRSIGGDCKIRRRGRPRRCAVHGPPPALRVCIVFQNREPDRFGKSNRARRAGRPEQGQRRHHRGQHACNGGRYRPSRSIKRPSNPRHAGDIAGSHSPRMVRPVASGAGLDRRQ